MDKLYLKPLGGLANRMRSILAALNLAQASGRQLEIIWERKKELNCAYAQLFKPTSAFALRESSALFLPSLKDAWRGDYFYTQSPPLWSPRSWLSKLGLTKAPYRASFLNPEFAQYLEELYQKKTYRHLNELRQDLHALFQERQSSFYHSKGSIYISSFYEFYEGAFSNQATQIFRPLDSLQAQINQFSQSATPFISLHIRQGDHQIARENSPLHRFEEIIQKHLDQNSSQSFFLATDSKEVEQVLQEKFGSQIRTRANDKRRDAAKGIQDALIDLYCLARGEKIYGSYWSSFSEMAARLGQIEEDSRSIQDAF